MYPLLQEFLRTTEHWLSLNIKTSYRDKLIDLYFAVNRFMKTAEQYDESYATCFEKNGKDLRIKLFCIDPSAPLERTLNRCKASIFFSATMTPTGYFRRIFGCKESTNTTELSSPFPRRNFCVVIANNISTLYKERDRTRPEVASAILALAGQRKGNYLLFFPSYEYMKMVHTTLALECSEVETLVQTPGMTENERAAFLEKFSQKNPETLMGFAVMGGIFGEGIDLVGDRLTGAVIVGVGLPGISPEREIIREFFGKTNQRGFEYAYQYPGINRVLQAGGRVIRSESDKGVVLLIDNRFSTPRYRSLFPNEWVPVMVQGKRQLRNVLQRFWNQ